MKEYSTGKSANSTLECAKEMGVADQFLFHNIIYKRILKCKQYTARLGITSGGSRISHGVSDQSEYRLHSCFYVEVYTAMNLSPRAL